MKEKSISFSFLKLKAKEKQISPKSSEEECFFCGKFRSPVSKLLIFTHSASCCSRSHGWQKRKTTDYCQKLNARVVSQIAENFRTNILKKWGTFKTAYLSFHWFNDSWVWTHNSWIWTHNSWIWTRNSWIWTHNLWIWTRNSWTWTRIFEFQLVFLSF